MSGRHWVRLAWRYCDTRLHVLLLDERLGCRGFSHGVVSPVSEPGLRCWQRQGLKLSVKEKEESSTLPTLWKMTGMGNVSEALVLSIVRAARLELPYGRSAKMAMVGRSVSFDGKPTHLSSHPVYRGVLTRFVNHAERGKPVSFSVRAQCPLMRSLSPVREKYGGAGRRCWKKRMRDCNGLDRGSRFALLRKEADFLCRCDWTTTVEVNPNEGSVYNE